MNFDIGGRCMMSFGGLYIGGGNRMQQAIGMNDTPDLVFADWARTEMPMGRFSDRALVRTYADDNLDLFAWLEKHGVKWEAYRPKPDRLDRSRTRLNCSAWPNEADQSRCAARASCGRWRKPRATWASTSCSSTG